MRSSREVLGIAQIAGGVGKGKFVSIPPDASDPQLVIALARGLS